MRQLEHMIRNVLELTIRGRYPHLKRPAVMYAEIVSVGEYRDSDDVLWQEYTLRLLDQEGAPDEKLPEIPKVRSKVGMKAGAKVAVALPYGELAPVLLGEVLL